MSNSLYISTTEAGSGKALVALGLLQQLLRRTPRVRFFRPVIQGTPPQHEREGEGGRAALDEDIELILRNFNLPQTDEESYGIGSDQINDLMATDRIDAGLDLIISRYKALEREGDFMLCEGSDFLGEGSAFEFELNQQIARSLGCPILILGNADRRSLADALRPVRIAVDAYRRHDCRIVAILLNKADPDQVEELNTVLAQEFGSMDCVLSVIPFDGRLISPRIRDIARHLEAEVLYGHARLDRLASHQIVAAMQMQHALDWLREGSLVITPGDRGDVIVGMLQAHESFNYPNLAGLLLTGLGPSGRSID
jgi:phosphate acetyltransferase